MDSFGRELLDSREPPEPGRVQLEPALEGDQARTFPQMFHVVSHDEVGQPFEGRQYVPFDFGLGFFLNPLLF